MKILELFAGYGSQALALKRLGLEFTAETSEIDKYAMQIYDMIHGATKHHGDITKINEKELGYFDLITYSSPCQDFSIAGKQRGGDKDSGTRSSLLWECERIIAEVKPKYLLMENVKNLVGKGHKHNFDAWLEVLEKLGYDNYWQVLNAKDYGVPQNRERVFVVSIRKDLNQGYKFPEKIPLEKRLKDILEPIVDEKFYLSDEQVARFQASNYNVTATRLQEKEWCDTLCARDYKDHKCVVEPFIAASRGRNPLNPSDRTAGSPTEQMLEINYSGCTNTLTSVQKDNYVVEPFIAYDTQGFDGVRYYDNYSPTLRSERSGLKVVEPKVIQVGNIVSTGNWDNPQIGRVYSSDGCSPTLNTCGGGSHEPKITEGYRIRKLTPRECWRLMGVDDADFDKLHDISNSQLYKMAGNSIVVDVLVEIFRNLFKETTPYQNYFSKEVQLNLF